MTSSHDLEKFTVSLIGADFNTGNNGVSALAWSSIKLIQNKWPKSKVVMIGVGRRPGLNKVAIDGNVLIIKTFPIRFCFNITVQNHIVKIAVFVLLARFFPFLKKRWILNDSSIGALLGSSIICDANGGDGFSDIYGKKRLFLIYLLSLVCKLAAKRIILLPQTYGPYRSTVARIMARSIISHANEVYSRDRKSFKQIQSLYLGRNVPVNVKLIPDVAFIMDAYHPKNDIISDIEKMAISRRKIIGLNVSGLLYNDNYPRSNMFLPASDYSDVIQSIIRFFSLKEPQSILLIPHVIPHHKSIDNDLEACLDVLNRCNSEHRKNIFLVNGQFNQNEIKYIIGKCNFFIGSRMHATIAAISQCIPTVGLAYSKKFQGVYETIGIEGCAVDLRHIKKEHVIDLIESIYYRSEDIRKKLEIIMPDINNKIYSMLEDI